MLRSQDHNTCVNPFACRIRMHLCILGLKLCVSLPGFIMHKLLASCAKIVGLFCDLLEISQNILEGIIIISCIT
jgi:hypothetical protein